MFFLIHALLFQAAFPDVPPSHWAFQAVNELKADGILVGYPTRQQADQETPDATDPRLGKTHGQVVKMGKEKWVDFVEKQQGYSTHTSSMAYYTYAESRLVTSQKLFSKLPKARQEQINNLLTHIRAFGNEIQALGEFFSGGGTMWIVIRAHTHATHADMRHDLILGKTSRSGSVPFSRLENRLKKIRTRLEKDWFELKDLHNPEQKLTTLLETHTVATKELNHIKKALQTMKDSDRKVVLKVCNDLLNVIEEQASGK